MKISPLINSGDRNDRRPRISDPIQPKKEWSLEESQPPQSSLRDPKTELQERVILIAHNRWNRS